MTLEFHEAANAFPLMDEERFIELRNDIAANGLRQPIMLCEGKILDGRNRARACHELGIKLRSEQFNGGDPWAYVWSLNGSRRDLSRDQRAAIWLEVEWRSEYWQEQRRRITEEANRKRSEATASQPRTEDGSRLAEKDQVLVQSEQVPEQERAPTRAAKAKAAGVSASAVARAEALRNARPDLDKAVREGTMKPTEARRKAKKDAVASRVVALPTDQYVVIYADPPWSYNDKQGGDISESYGAAEKHYPSMTLSELKALSIKDLAASDSVLFLWATSPLLPDALALASAWGFTYKASFVWDKVKHNMGHYNSVRHELLLVCTKGSCTPQNVKLYDSVQSIERSGHSSKPEEFRTIIDTIYPHGNRIELFRRGEAPAGWAVWGNETK